MPRQHIPTHPETLYVIAVMANPNMWASRHKLAEEFVQRTKGMKSVHLTTVEMAFGGRPFQLKNVGDTHIQVRGNTEIWTKESMLNIALSRLTPEAKKIAWVDMDVEFLDSDWAHETLHALEHYKVVWPWSFCIDSGPRGEVVQTHKSFGSLWVAGAPRAGTYGYGGDFFHPGFSVAYRREVLDGIGGMPTFGVLGAGDHHLALAMIGDVKNSLPGGIHPNYAKAAYNLQALCDKHVQQDIGYIPGTIKHHWHGGKSKRKYVERWHILVKHQFDPEVDVVKDIQGLPRLAGNKPGLRDDLRAYFLQRSEDSIDLE